MQAAARAPPCERLPAPLAWSRACSAFTVVPASGSQATRKGMNAILRVAAERREQRSRAEPRGARGERRRWRRAAAAVAGGAAPWRGCCRARSRRAARTGGGRRSKDRGWAPQQGQGVGAAASMAALPPEPALAQAAGGGGGGRRADSLALLLQLRHGAADALAGHCRRHRRHAQAACGASGPGLGPRGAGCLLPGRRPCRRGPAALLRLPDGRKLAADRAGGRQCKRHGGGLGGCGA